MACLGPAAAATRLVAGASRRVAGAAVHARTLAGSVPLVFDRRVKRLQRDRAAAAPNVRDYERLRDEVAWQISDRVQDIDRIFTTGMDLGCGRGHVGRQIDSDMIETLVQLELSGGLLSAFDADARDRGFRLQADEEALPFRADTFDIVVSNLSMHWVNDLPGCLTQIKNCLVPDGAFIGSIFGGDTLYELRCSLQLAEIERKGGFAPRVSPFADVRDCGSLLQRAGFTLLTVDVDDITINYPSPFELIEDLRGMGESNAALKRHGRLDPGTLAAAAAIYGEMYGNDDGSIPATFQVIYLLGWKPDPSQAKPAARGSATHSFSDVSAGMSLEGLQSQIDAARAEIQSKQSK
mmetsp:Transcript_20950/g.54481  ORF Transcript_20950/g.54481 Transcript_20950/m.54481 type:complete len:351 (-) Transcript_20950:1089-2141(-)